MARGRVPVPVLDLNLASSEAADAHTRAHSALICCIRLNVRVCASHGLHVQHLHHLCGLAAEAAEQVADVGQMPLTCAVERRRAGAFRNVSMGVVLRSPAKSSDVAVSRPYIPSLDEASHGRR